MGTERNPADLKVALIFSMLGVIPHLIYTFVVFFSIGYVSLYKALMLGVVAWMIAAAILVIAWQNTYKLKEIWLTLSCHLYNHKSVCL